VSVPVTAVEVLLAALLFYSGLNKVVGPAALAEALGELLGRHRFPLTPVRLLAAVEVAAALLVAVAPDLTATRAVVAVLGAGFTATGLAGRLRGSAMPCGCFGRQGARSLGLWNTVLGLAFVAWSVLPAPDTPYGWQPRLALVCLVATATPLYANRRYLAMLSRRAGALRRLA
jgi:hypothetical protein